MEWGNLKLSMSLVSPACNFSFALYTTDVAKVMQMINQVHHGSSDFIPGIICIEILYEIQRLCRTDAKHIPLNKAIKLIVLQLLTEPELYLLCPVKRVFFLLKVFICKVLSHSWSELD